MPVCYDYKTLLQFFIQVSTTMSAGMVQELQGHARIYHLKDANNHNIFL